MRIRTGALYLGSFAGTDASDLAPPVFAPPVFAPPVFAPPVFAPPVFAPPVFAPPTMGGAPSFRVRCGRVGGENLKGTPGPGFYLLFGILDHAEVTEEYRVYTPKNVFSGQIYENKGNVFEIPS
jgi:hypothetical protein